MTRVHATSAVPGEDQEVREAAWAAGKLVAFVSAFEVVPRCRCGHPAAVVIRQSVETAGLSIREGSAGPGTSTWPSSIESLVTG
jgi:hypothetical protein